MGKEIFLDAPNLGPLEKKNLIKIVDSGFVSTVGPQVTEFELTFAKRINVAGAVSTQSGTAALHLALREIGVGPGDEVIVPCLSFIASVSPVTFLGATPVLVDVDRETWNVSPSAIKSAITPKTKAIIPVHLYGNPCDMTAITAIARDHDLYVIEDATESLGSRYKERMTGSIGDIGCFSFNGNKVITTGGGGMVVTDNLDWCDHIKYLVTQAKDRDCPSFHSEIGFNYGMTNLEAALGLAQMQRLDEFLGKKTMLQKVYRQELSSERDIKFQMEYPDGVNNFWFTAITIERDIDLTELQKTLLEEGIPTRRVFVPMTEFPPLQNYKRGADTNAQDIYQKGLCLPCSTLNSLDSAHLVSKKLKDALSAKHQI